MTILNIYIYIHHVCNYIFQYVCSSRRFFEDKLSAEALDPEMRVSPAELSDFDSTKRKKHWKIWEGIADDGGIFE